MDAKLRASRERPHGSAGGEGIRRHRMRFSVRVRTQNASFRRVRFSSPGQTRRCLTEKRSLQPAPHEKAHSGQMAHGKAQSGLIDSRKGALCDSQVAQTAPFRHVATPGRCGATPRQAAGRLARGSADLGLSLTSRKGALCPTGGLQTALFRHDATAECAFP